MNSRIVALAILLLTSSGCNKAMEDKPNEASGQSAKVQIAKAGEQPPLTLPASLKEEAELGFTVGDSYYLWLITPAPIKGRNENGIAVEFDVGFMAAPGQPPKQFREVKRFSVGDEFSLLKSIDPTAGQAIGRFKVQVALKNSKASGKGDVTVSLSDVVKDDDAESHEKTISNRLRVDVEIH